MCVICEAIKCVCLRLRYQNPGQCPGKIKARLKAWKALRNFAILIQYSKQTLLATVIATCWQISPKHSHISQHFVLSKCRSAWVVLSGIWHPASGYKGSPTTQQKWLTFIGRLSIRGFIPTAAQLPIDLDFWREWLHRTWLRNL